MDKNPFIGSISCDDQHRSANKVRNADHVTTRSEVKDPNMSIYNYNHLKMYDLILNT